MAWHKRAMAIRDTQAIVVGGGAAGLTTALGLSQAGIETLLLGVPETIVDDGRSAALFETSLACLDKLGVGDALRARGAPLAAIRIIDITDGLIRAPDVVFRASEIGQRAFGWNIPNAAILDEMIRFARTASHLTLSTAAFEHMTIEGERVCVTASDGAVYSAPVVIGADGQNSPVRAAAGITHREKPYPQVALTARLTHTRDHHDESLEFHTREGPFTFVPLGDGVCALVWIMQPEKADAMLAGGAEAMARIAERRSFHALGALEIQGRIGRVPMRKLVADALVGARVALVGEAAHAFPPIGAQGLNLGLRDVEALIERLASAHRSGADLGSAKVLADYARDRRVDVEARSAAVDVMNSALISGLLPADLLRAAGLGLMRDIPPLRRLAMRIGGGGSGLRLPQFRLPALR